MQLVTLASQRTGAFSVRRIGLAVCLWVISLHLACSPPASPGPEATPPQGSPASPADPATGEQSTGEQSTGDPATGEQSSTSSGEPGQVLRHAVFFQFKESSTDEQIGQVVEAFRGLPSKIGAITNFCWGTSNSPEGLDDGFTHCFLLSFADEDGRAEYLPHAEHKAFGDVLRPHMERVFVIDFWGSPPAQQQPDAQPAQRELKHAVFFKFKDDADPAAIEAVEEAFAALPGKIDSIKAFEWGRNNSPEKHSNGFTHCFLVTFDSEEGRAAYLPHPDHQAFVKLLEPVLDKARVLDFWAEK